MTFMFSYFPLHGWVYALYDYRAPLKLSQSEFVGLKCEKTGVVGLGHSVVTATIRATVP